VIGGGGEDGAHEAREVLHRTYRASALVFLAALLVSLGARSAWISGGIAAGYGLGIAVLLSWQFIVRHALGGGLSPRPGGEISAAAARAAAPAAPRRGLAIGLGVAKIPVLLALIYLLIGRGWVSPLGFAAGFVIPQVTIALLAVGRVTGGRRAAARAGGGLGT
jgi:hypothetical protein